MPRKSERGQYILSAGEIGVYSVCPESWRLKMIEKRKGYRGPSISEGLKLHEEWAKKYDNAVYLSRNAKLLVLLVVVTIIIYMLMSHA